MTTTFAPVVPNQDIWINPDPQGLWARVAVCSRWADAKKIAKHWGHRPAMVGPLRTKGGVDLLVRGLLANPQITVLIVDGPDLLPSNGAGVGLDAFFLTRDYHTAGLGSDVIELLSEDGMTPVVTLVACNVALANMTPTEIDAGDGIESTFTDIEKLLGASPREDRPGGKHVLPPPAPKAESVAPPGDPGERIAADTLGQLWPQLLRRVLDFGRVAPTQYGQTKELLNVVSVIRDPRATLDEFKATLRWKGTAGSNESVKPTVVGTIPVGPVGAGGNTIFVQASPDAGAVRETEITEDPHPVLGKTWSDVLAYYNFVTGEKAPEGAPYTYGSRMHGAGNRVQQELLAGADLLRSEGAVDLALGLQVLGQTLGVDQFRDVSVLLLNKPDTRAAFLTPWRPDEDSGKESGRPCLTGVWFRRTFDATPAQTAYIEAERIALRARALDPVGSEPERLLNACDPLWWAMTQDERDFLPVPTLHMTVTFRSHDLYGAYPMNIAALCMWLMVEAEVQSMAVGSLTCVSFSAHVYDRDWNAARELSEAHRPKGIQWDQRSSWRVERGPAAPPLPITPGEVVKVPRSASGVEEEWEVLATPAGDGMHMVKCRSTGEEVRATDTMIRYHRRDPQSKPGPLRAVAMEPGEHGSKVVAVFEAQSAAALRSKVERSGLCTSVGSALWLGDEIRRVAGGE